MKVSVIGTGYVGLVTGTCLADTGHHVICVDIDKAKIKQMQSGEVPIYEPDLEEIFTKNVKSGRLTFTDSLEEGVKNAEVIFLALPTPSGEDGSADLTHILNVADELGRYLTSYSVIVDKSTVPVGTSIKVKENINKTAKVKFDVVSNPEFLREGLAVSDFQNPDRIIVGTSSKEAELVMRNLYKSYISSGSKFLVMDEGSAELTKYVANVFLATKISFINQIANLAEQLNVNIDNVKLGIGSDPRIGSQFLNAGIGYGGSCFPKDVTALLHIASVVEHDLPIVSAVKSINDAQKHRLSDKVLRYFNSDVRNKKFALWGLAFKPDTDDVREAPSIEIINNLIENGALINAYDPQAASNIKKLITNENLNFVSDKYEALKDVDALLIATEWQEFKSADLDKVKSLLKSKLIFDGRNMYDLETMRKLGFYYESIGRQTVLKNDADE